MQTHTHFVANSSRPVDFDAFDLDSNDDLSFAIGKIHISDDSIGLDTAPEQAFTIEGYGSSISVLWSLK